jgi:hypothetical protein
MSRILHLFFVVVIVTIVAIATLVQFGPAAFPITKPAASSGPITILTSNWYNPQTRKFEGFVGDTGDRLNLVIVNGNAFPIRYLNATLTPLQSNTITNLTGGRIVLGDLSSYDQVIGSGNTAGLNFTANVSPGASPGLVPINLTLSYNQYGVNTTGYSQVILTTVSVYGLAVPSVLPVLTSVVFGKTSAVSFKVSNAGKGTMYSPSVSIKFPPASSSPVVVGSPVINSSNQIGPGGSQVFSLNVTNGARTIAGTYPGTLVVAFSDIFGQARSDNFAIAITFTGIVAPTLQSSRIVQTVGNLTIVGSIVNYGTSPAFFTNVSAYLNSSGISGSSRMPTYIGTIQPRATAYFTLTIAYSPLLSNSKNVNVVVRISYQNGTGASLFTKNSTNFVVLPASQLSQSPGERQILIIEAGLGAVVAVVALIVLLTYRDRLRNWGSSRRKPEKAPQEVQKQDKVKAA